MMEQFKAVETITPRLPSLPTPHARFMGLSGTSLRVAIGLTSGLCFVAFGYGQGDIGGLLTVDAFREYFPSINALNDPMDLSIARVAGTVIATWNLGCFVGAMLTIFVGNILGRRGTIILGLVIMTIGKAIQVTTFSLGQYIAGRFIAGLGNGFIASTVPAWQAECLKTHRRGTMLLVSFGSCITAGIAIAYWIDYGFSWFDSTLAWRAPIGLGTIFTVAPLFLILFLPESPRYLVLTGREHAAKATLSALNEISPDDEDIQREFLMIKNTILYMASGRVSEAFKMGQYRYLHRTILAVLLQVMQQFTGVNLFIQYLGTMFNAQLAFKTDIALLLAACCATVFFVTSLAAVVGIDRFWGRRALTMFGATGMCVCMIVLCVMAYIGTQTTHYVMAAFLFLYCSFFSIGWQGMSWMWAVELTPLSTRGPANALATAANWLSNFVVVISTPVLFGNVTYKTYIIFAVTNFVIVPTIYILYPETGSRSLEEVDLIFARAHQSPKPWCSAVAAAAAAHRDPSSFGNKEPASDSYDSEAVTTTRGEKGIQSVQSSESDAVLWQRYCRERESSMASASSGAGDEDGAAPAPEVRRASTNVLGTFGRSFD